MKPSKRRLESMRRARGRAVDGADRKKISDHPWVVVGLGAILGILGTIVTTGVSDWYSQHQYWRARRTAAYVEYATSLMAADIAVNSLRTDITRATLQEASVDTSQLDARRKQLTDAASKLDSTAAPVLAIEQQELSAATNATYRVQYYRVQAGIFVIDNRLKSVKLDLDTQSELLNILDRPYETSRDTTPEGKPLGYPSDFIDAARVQMHADR